MSAQTTLGTTIGRYRIARLLGGGEVGRVFACKAPEKEQLVAIKILRTKHASLGDGIMKSRMQLEKIVSPHVAKIHDVAVFNNVVFVVMELVEGESLAEALAKGRMRTVDALALARGIVLGLQAAWAHGIAHGDLRPANVLLPRGEIRAPKLVDFQLAAPVEGTESVRGSPSYLAPELLVGTPPDALTDLYALGCLLTEVLTGKPPFVGSASSVLQAQSATTPPTLARTMPGAPQGIVDLVDRLLEKDRAKRVKTHGEALAGIERALQGQSMAAPKGPDLPAFLDVDVDLAGFDDERTDEFHLSPARESAGSDEQAPARREPARTAAPAKPVDDIGIYRSTSSTSSSSSLPPLPSSSPPRFAPLPPLPPLTPLPPLPPLPPARAKKTELEELEIEPLEELTGIDDMDGDMLDLDDDVESTQLRPGIAPAIPSADDLGLILTPVNPPKRK